MADHLKPNTSAFLARQRRHRHNSFLGHAALARQNMIAIINADSTSEQSKDLAKVVYKLLEILANSLRTRIDPPRSPPNV